MSPIRTSLHHAIELDPRRWPTIVIRLLAVASADEVTELQTWLNEVLRKRERFARVVQIQATWRAQQRAQMRDWYQAHALTLARYCACVAYVTEAEDARAALNVLNLAAKQSSPSKVFEDLTPALIWAQGHLARLR